LVQRNESKKTERPAKKKTNSVPVKLSSLQKGEGKDKLKNKQQEHEGSKRGENRNSHREGRLIGLSLRFVKRVAKKKKKDGKSEQQNLKLTGPRMAHGKRAKG